ncbi:MAG: TolC family protein [Desulfobulbaceae bacterium]|nr:TolC family protein [Desulfobulbaceae bacterium]
MLRLTTYISVLLVTLLWNLTAGAEDSFKNDLQQRAAQHGKSPSLDTLEILDLESAQRIALAENPSLAAAASRVKAAKALVGQAASSYWPRFDSEATYSQVALSSTAYSSARQTARFFNPQAEVDDPEEYYSADLTATWTLFDGFERQFAVSAAKYGFLESKEAFREGNRLLLAALAQSYFNAMLSRENMSIAQANIDYYAELHKEAQAKRQVGAGSLSTVLTIEVQLNNAKAQLIAARHNHAAALAGLNALMGREEPLPDTIKLPLLQEEESKAFDTPDINAMVRYALDNRPDIRQLEYRIGSADSREKQAKALLYPRLDLKATYNGDRDDNGHFNQDDFGDTIMLNLSFNIFAGGYYTNKISEARHRKTAAKSDLEELKISITGEIRQDYAQLQSAQEQLMLQRSNVQLVQRNRDLVKKEYEAGQALLIRLTEAQRDLITSQSFLAQSRVALRLAWHTLETDTGRKLELFEK